MKAKLTVLVTAVLFGLLLMLPAVALAGGDQVHRPVETPQFQAGGDYPMEWGFGK